MKRLISTAAVIMISMINPASGKENNLTAYDARHQTVTQKGQALAKSRIPKPKLFRSNPHRISHFIYDPDDEIFVQDDDLATGYRRRDLTKIEHPDGISERVRWRLFLARQLAMLKYRELHG